VNHKEKVSFTNCFFLYLVKSVLRLFLVCVLFRLPSAYLSERIINFLKFAPPKFTNSTKTFVEITNLCFDRNSAVVSCLHQQKNLINIVTKKVGEYFYCECQKKKSVVNLDGLIFEIL
jgi:hypothetical protein